VLEQCGKGQVFKPPNPWTMSIVRLLAELYHYAELKLKAKFEIEVLSNALGLELKDITPTDLLKNRRQSLEVHKALEAMARMSLTQTDDTFYKDHAEEGGTQLLNNMLSYIHMTPTLLQHQLYVRAFILALDRAIREIIEIYGARASETAVSIARSMVLKDFAASSDDKKMRQSAHIMVRALAVNLVNAMVKDVLATQVHSNVCAVLNQNHMSENLLPEHVVAEAVHANREFLCTVIERMTVEGAVQDIDDTLSSAYAERRNARERGIEYTDKRFYNTSQLPSNLSEILPNILRTGAPEVPSKQGLVYDDFDKVQQHSAQFAQQRYAQPESSGALDHALDAAPLAANKVYDTFALCVGELDKLINNIEGTSNWKTLPQQHDITLLIRQIPLLALQSANPDDTALDFSQTIVHSVYKSTSQRAREVYVQLLKRMCEVSIKVAKEVVTWLTYADDERKYNVPATVTLMQERLIDLSEQDLQLAKSIEGGRSSAIEFTTSLIRACILETDAFAKPLDFKASLDARNKLVQHGRATDR